MEESSEGLISELMRQMRSLRSYYRWLILCGSAIAVALILAAWSVIHTWWGRFGAVWLAGSLICAVLWIYLNAYLRVKWEIGYYQSLYEISRPKTRRSKTRRSITPLFVSVRKAMLTPYFFFFLLGFLLALLIAVRLQDEYETAFFDGLARKVTAGSPSVPGDSVIVRSLHVTHELLVSRSMLYNQPAASSWIGKYIHPLSSDLVTADGACGSYASVLCRLLQEMDFKTRLIQMKGTDGIVCHIIVEVRSDKGWVVLDPLYDLYFVRKDGVLASFGDVSSDWSWYSKQTPPGYNPVYSYNGARYTNWSKVPVVMPLARWIIGWQMDQYELDHFSLRPYVLRKYRIMEYAIILTLLLLLVRPLFRLGKRTFSIRWILPTHLQANQ